MNLDELRARRTRREADLQVALALLNRAERHVETARKAVLTADRAVIEAETRAALQEKTK